MSRLLSKIKYDFLVFCALSKERSAYTRTDSKLGNLPYSKWTRLPGDTYRRI